MRIFLVGARTEAEFFSFRLCGFSEENIFAIDSAIYIPLIQLMNAESLDFPDCFFDVVVIGWVLEFVLDIEKVRSEILRILSDGGILAVGAMYHPRTQDMEEYSEIKEHTDRRWKPASTSESSD